MKNKSLLNLLLVFTNIGTVLIILASVFLSTLLIISYFNPAFKPGFSIGTFNYVPTTEISGEYITENSSSTLPVDSIKVTFKEFHPEPKILIFLIASIIITALITLYILLQVTHVLRSLKQNLIFILGNALRIRQIALAMIIAWGLSKLISVVFMSYFMEKLVFKNFRFQSYELGDDRFIPSLVSGIVLWIIAEVFRYGTELKKESDLTI